MLDREELGRANRSFSLGTLLACGDLGGETRVSRRWRWEERREGKLKAVSIVCRLGIDIPGIPDAGDGEASSMKRDSSLREGWSESSLLFLPGCKLILLSVSPCSSSMGNVSKFSLNSSSILTEEWSTQSTNRSKITSAAISAMLRWMRWWQVGGRCVTDPVTLWPDVNRLSRSICCSPPGLVPPRHTSLLRHHRRLLQTAAFAETP